MSSQSDFSRKIEVSRAKLKRVDKLATLATLIEKQIRYKIYTISIRYIY